VEFCFVHAADLHLDTPYDGVGLASSAVAEALREASLDAFDDLVRLTLDRAAAFLVLAGDIYDGAERGIRAQLRFLNGLRRLSEAGIAVFVAHGNHDPIGGWPGVRAWPPGVRIFGSQEVETFEVERDGAVIARVSGISYGRRDVSENLAARFHADGGEGVEVAVLHCNVGGDTSHAPYSPCVLDDLVRSGHEYWALGHIHQRVVLHEGRPWVVYPGGIQGRSLKPSERGAKGACVVHVDGGAVRSVEPMAVDRVRFALIELDVSGVADVGDLRARLQVAAERVRATAEGRSLVVRAMVRGRGPVHRDLSCAGGVEGVLRDLRDEYEGEQPFVWWESVRDATRAELNLEGIRGRGDFSAAVLERVDALLETGPAGGPVEYVGRVIGTAPRKALSLIVSPEPEEARAILEEARALALDLLEDEADACA
jgi:DNA repair exonuclease SbcCD nuclease subunit